MTSWHDFTIAEPELAERARSILTSTTNAVLGTIRADGSPRLSGIDPFFVGSELWFGSMDNARKGADLVRDPRCSLHAIPWESRKVKDGAADPGEADVKVSGRAVRFTEADPDHATTMAAFVEDRGFEPPPGADLFRLELDTVTVVSVDHEANQLVIDRWSAAGGRVVVRRD
jgi:hypothetical protein